MLNATFGNVVEMMITVNTLRATRPRGSNLITERCGKVWLSIEKVWLGLEAFPIRISFPHVSVVSVDVCHSFSSFFGSISEKKFLFWFLP